MNHGKSDVEQDAIRLNRKMPLLLSAWALVIPFVVLAVHTQFSFLQGSRNSDSGQEIASQIAAPDAGVSMIFRLLLYAAYGVMIWCIGTNLSQVLLAARRCKPALLVCAIACASVLWSQEPTITLRNSAYYFIDTLFAFYLLSEFTLEELMELVMMAGITLAILSAFVILAFPQYGLVQQTVHLGVWQGVFSEKNDAAKNWIFLLTPVCNRRILQMPSMAYGAVILLFLVMTRSATALIALPLYVAFMLALPLLRRMKLSSIAFGAASVAMISVAILMALVTLAPQIAGYLGRDLTLTGRTEIWSALLQSVHKHPLLGYGYSAFWTGMDGESGLVYSTIRWYFTYAHNGLLEVVLQVGLIGLAAVVLMVFQGAADAVVSVRRYDNLGIDWLAGLIFLTVLYNLDEGTMMFTHSLVSMILVLACGGLAIVRSRIRIQHLHSLLESFGVDAAVEGASHV